MVLLTYFNITAGLISAFKIIESIIDLIMNPLNIKNHLHFIKIVVNL